LDVPCGEQPLAVGVLAAVQPHLAQGESVGIGVRLPDRRQEIVAWIRDFDPMYPTTYWLRTPLALPAGSVLIADGRGRCSITVTITPR
jgi:hypothetical protein